MAFKSVYLPAPTIRNDTIEVTDEEHHHLAVGRAEPGEIVEVFDGLGRVWKCVVVSTGKRATTLRVEGTDSVPPPAVELILGQALIRPAVFELALEKAVEVGVTRIMPFVAGRSNHTTLREDRWRRIVVEAAKQSKRFHVPRIDTPMKFDQILAEPAASRILFAESEGGSLKPALHGSPVLYLIGPEGGWTELELELAGRAGFRSVSLRSGILRSETAAIVGASLIRYELGDL